MCELVRLSEVVGDIYDAALNPSRWTCVLGKTARFVGGPAACLVAKDAVGNIRNNVFGISANYQRLYLDQGTRLDPSDLCNLIADAQELIGADDIIPYDQFLETRFYREWARPQGFVDFVARLPA